MTPADLQVIRTTFRLAAGDPHGFLVEFRRRALKADDSLRTVLPPLDPAQSTRIFAILNATLAAIPSNDGLTGAIVDLAQRHRLPGLQRKHYGAVGQALLDTIAARTSADEAARTAWVGAYVTYTEATMALCYNPMDLVA